MFYTQKKVSYLNQPYLSSLAVLSPSWLFHYVLGSPFFNKEKMDNNNSQTLRVKLTIGPFYTIFALNLLQSCKLVIRQELWTFLSERVWFFCIPWANQERGLTGTHKCPRSKLSKSNHNILSCQNLSYISVTLINMFIPVNPG